MPAVDHYLTWLSAMHAEAARLHHREIEPEHMLLGLLAQGGTAAAVLATQDVTLTRARAAIDEMADTDLARVGISLSDALRPSPIAAEELTAKEGGEIPSRTPPSSSTTRGLRSTPALRPCKPSSPHPQPRSSPRLSDFLPIAVSMSTICALSSVR